MFDRFWAGTPGLHMVGNYPDHRNRRLPNPPTAIACRFLGRLCLLDQPTLIPSPNEVFSSSRYTSGNRALVPYVVATVELISGKTQRYRGNVSEAPPMRIEPSKSSASTNQRIASGAVAWQGSLAGHQVSPNLTPAPHHQSQAQFSRARSRHWPYLPPI